MKSGRLIRDQHVVDLCYVQAISTRDQKYFDAVVGAFSMSKRELMPEKSESPPSLSTASMELPKGGDLEMGTADFHNSIISLFAVKKSLM